MISLSIYCSTQTMSVAIYDGKILLDILNKKITQNKIDYLPLIIQKILTSNNIKSLDRILFCRGPGSYTANRSIKALAQGLSLAKNSKLVTLDNFEVYLGNITKKYDESIVFFQDFNNKFFIKLFCKRNEKFIEKMLLEKVSKKPNTVIVSDHKYSLNKFNKINVNITYLSPNASHLANSFFNGYGVENLEIIYHHTYYK